MPRSQRKSMKTNKKKQNKKKVAIYKFYNFNKVIN